MGWGVGQVAHGRTHGQRAIGHENRLELNLGAVGERQAGVASEWDRGLVETILCQK